MHQYKQSSHTDVYIYIRLPEDEPLVSKQVEDIKKNKNQILIQEMCISLVNYSARCKTCKISELTTGHSKQPISLSVSFLLHFLFQQ